MNNIFDSDRPIYLQIAEKMSAAIITGEFPLASRVPPVRELAQQLSVNPNTVQRALSELESKGILVTQSTTGRFVNSDSAVIDELKLTLAKRETTSFVSKMETIGIGKQQIIELINEVKSNE